MDGRRGLPRGEEEDPSLETGGRGDPGRKSCACNIASTHNHHLEVAAGVVHVAVFFKVPAHHDSGHTEEDE